MRASITTWPTYRHVVRLDLRHEDALPAVRSIESVLEGIERSTLYLVHMYLGERFTSWTRLELGHFFDDPYFWAARTVLGYSVLKSPVVVDLMALTTAGDFTEHSPTTTPRKIFSPTRQESVSREGLRSARTCC